VAEYAGLKRKAAAIKAEVKPAPTPSYKNGWVKEDSKWYYYKDGVKQVGWLLDAGKWYYLGADGVMQTGWVEWKGKMYFLEKDGSMVSDTQIDVGSDGAINP
jgi:glucan-binding YG repeat protein